ncbi:hypothetical protein BESB_007890 [Besnoitia besnoiti]|uniref:RNA recognition motif-containing protein n=1 Tax=Besnoitia besnoiti TaxID=94643 RepID=A0A2A9MQF6_BESBE|nr:hypothetical protein BESB_007890 [Besnoitia besnoiti]PFH38447.1 hypothetical protein BESB_007890 [Besnoitia besnoiti]
MKGSRLPGGSVRLSGTMEGQRAQESRSPELAVRMSGGGVQQTVEPAAPQDSVSEENAHATAKAWGGDKGLSGSTAFESRETTECIADKKDFMEVEEQPTLMSAQSTNSSAGGYFPSFLPATNEYFHSDDSPSAGGSPVVSLSSASFASISSSAGNEDGGTPESRLLKAADAAGVNSSHQLETVQEMQPEGRQPVNDRGASYLFSPLPVPRAGWDTLKGTESKDALAPSNLLESVYQKQDLLCLLLEMGQMRARGNGSNGEKRIDNSGDTSLRSSIVSVDRSSWPDKAPSMGNNNGSARSSQAVRCEKRDLIVNELSRLWKGNTSVEPQALLENVISRGEDSQIHSALSSTGEPQEPAPPEGSTVQLRRHAIHLDEDSLFSDLSAAWDLDVAEESAAERHGRAARRKQESCSLFEARREPELSSQNICLPHDVVGAGPTPGPAGLQDPQAGSGTPQYIGRRQTFPGGEVGQFDLENQRAYGSSCDAAVGEYQAENSFHRRHSGPFPLPLPPSDDVLGGRSLGHWDETERQPHGTPGYPYLEECGSQMSPSQASDFLGTQGTMIHTTTSFSANYRASPGSNRAGQAKYTLIVNVPPTTTRQDLYMTFSAFGKVELTVVVCDKDHRHPHREWTATSGYAFVRFSSSSEAANAVAAAAVGGIRMRGSRIRATWAKKDSMAKPSAVTNAVFANRNGALGSEYFGGAGAWQPTTTPANMQAPHVSPPPPDDDRRRIPVLPAAPSRETLAGEHWDCFKVPLASCLTPESAQEFACRLCRRFIAFDPIILPCWHLFCSDCFQAVHCQQVDEVEGIVVNCPECGGTAPVSAIKKVDQAEAGILSKLRQLKDAEAVFCPFVPLCQWTGTATEFASHTHSHMAMEGGSFNDTEFAGYGLPPF